MRSSDAQFEGRAAGVDVAATCAYRAPAGRFEGLRFPAHRHVRVTAHGDLEDNRQVAFFWQEVSVILRAADRRSAGSAGLFEPTIERVDLAAAVEGRRDYELS